MLTDFFLLSMKIGIRIAAGNLAKIHDVGQCFISTKKMANLSVDHHAKMLTAE
jgi:hypothetical protein